MADWLTGTSGIEWLQGFGSPPVDLVVRAITELGAWPLLVVLTLLVYWVDGRRDGLWLAWLLVASMFASELLKLAFAEPRPPEALWKAGADGFGLPSGHATAAAAFWPAALLRPVRRWSAGLSATLVVLVAFSRVYLGVHYPLDVLAGALLGLSLFGCAWLLRRQAFSLPRKYLAFGFVAVGLALGGLFALSVAIAPEGSSPAFYPFGLGVGLLVGAAVGGVRPESLRLSTQVRMLGRSALLALIGFSAYLVLPTDGWAETFAPLLAAALALGAAPWLQRRPQRGVRGPLDP